MISGASVSMANNSTPGLGTQLTISSGELNLVSGHTAGVDTFDLTGGRLTGSDTLNTDLLNWSGGRMAGSGITTVVETLTMSGSLFLDDTRTLSFTNSTNSTPNWIGGSLSGTGAFLNSGKLIKNEASTTTLSISSFSHSGSIEVLSGTLSINPVTLTSTGDYTVTTPGILQFSGSYTFNSGNFTGNGMLEFGSGSSQ